MKSTQASIARADKILAQYSKDTAEDAIIDLLTDLHHYAASLELDYARCIDASYVNFVAERLIRESK